MSSSTATVQRRSVKYRGYEMILEDAERLAAEGYVTVGNWSFGQILDHLAKSLEGSIDGPAVRLAWPLRVLGRVFLKGRFLNRTVPAGFRFPDGSNSRFAPPPKTTLDEGLAALRRSIARCQTQRQRGVHPLLGRLDRVEWDRFNLRHAELHMSFVVPTGDGGPRTSAAATSGPVARA